MVFVSSEDFEPVRGTRDFLPREKIARDGIEARLRKLFEKYGFNPLQTPALENYSVLSSKYAGGAEILKETYKLADQGGRELGLRYDLTVPLCRVIACNPSIALPFKRYAIAPVWRDGPVSPERLREFTQCDVDTVGTESVLADAEFLALASEFFDSLGLDYEVRLNNRVLLEALLEWCGVPGGKALEAMLSLDKLDKVGGKGVLKELDERGFGKEVAEKVLETVRELRGGKGLDKAGELGLQENGLKALGDVRKTVEFAQAMGAKNVVFDASLARGLSYYTGNVFEAVLLERGVSASVAGGGRYDNLIGAFLGGRQKIPAVGISFGLERVFKAASEKTGLARTTVVRAFVIGLNKEKGLAAVKALREAGVNADLDLKDRGVSKCLDYAGKQGIRFAVIAGEREEGVTVRDLVEGSEKKVSLKQLPQAVA